MFIFCLDHKWRQDVTGFMGNEDVSNLTDDYTLPSEQVLKAKDKKRKRNSKLAAIRYVMLHYKLQTYNYMRLHLVIHRVVIIN